MMYAGRVESDCTNDIGRASNVSAEIAAVMSACGLCVLTGLACGVKVGLKCGVYMAAG